MNDQSGGGVGNTGTMVAGGDIVGRDKIIHHHGISEERLLALFTQSQQRLLEDARKAGLHTSTIMALARRLNPNVPDPDQAVVELTRAVELALEVIARGERGSNEDALVNAVLAEVAERTRNNDLDGGAKAIADALAEIDRRETAQRETAQRERIALLDASIRQHTLRQDAVAVAEQIERSVAVQHVTSGLLGIETIGLAMTNTWKMVQPRGSISPSRLQSSALAEWQAPHLTQMSVAWQPVYSAMRCRNSGNARAAPRGWSRLSTPFATRCWNTPASGTPLLWAGTQNNLGNALTGLGERESGTSRLERPSRHIAKPCWNRHTERVPLDWAKTQNNLGNALLTLGERESGTARLEQAVKAYRQALKERTRERVPLDWARRRTTSATRLRHSGNGSAARSGCERRSTPVAKRCWKGPASACHSTGRRPRTTSATRSGHSGNARAAPTRLSKRSMPIAKRSKKGHASACRLQWARTQNNLGNALRESGNARAAQSGWNKRSRPIATPCRNGHASACRSSGPDSEQPRQSAWTLGERESGTARLEQAVEAFRNALEEWTQEHAPYYHSVSQRNLELVLEAVRKKQAGD